MDEAEDGSGNAVAGQGQRRLIVPALFHGAVCLDWVLMVAGAVLAVLHGTVLPAAMLFFGLLTNAFVNQYTSAQLATYDLTFDPLDYIREGRLGNVDINIVLTGFINFTNITGGVVNCSDSYELLPFNQTFDDVLQLGVTRLARCLDNADFIKEVDLYTLIFVGLAVAVWVLGATHVLLFRLSASRQVGHVRCSVLCSALWQEIGWFDTTQPGQLSSRLNEDVVRLEEGLGERLGLLLQWLTTMLVGVGISAWVEWRLTLAMAATGVLIASSTALLSVFSFYCTSRSLSLHAKAASLAEEALSFITTVKAFGGEKEELKRYTHTLYQARWNAGTVGIVVAECLAAVQFLVFVSYGGSLWLGAYLVQEEFIQAGEFITVFFAVLVVGVSVGQALPHIQRLAVAQSAASTLRNISSRVPTVRAGHVWPEEGVRPSIAFQSVTFSYPSRPQRQILKGLSMSVGEGETVAVVGTTGCGKSTLLQLILNFYSIENGQVTIGGYNVASLEPDQLRGMVGMVSQDPALFHGTIAENIALGIAGGGGREASQQTIEKAARQAFAHDFISNLPNGYMTVLGEGGTQLSGGQRQRIAIARALIRQPQILLLDEATSSLDTESERIVQEALDKARQGRTTIIIAHRLSTVQQADRILVLDGGQVVESGSHHQLLQKKGHYYHLVQAQLNSLEVPATVLHPALSDAGVDHTNPSSPSSSSSPLSPSVHLPSNVESEALEAAPRQVSWLRVLSLSWPELWLVVLGVVHAAIQGAIFPIFALFFGHALEGFTYPFLEVLGRTHKWAGLLTGLGLVAAYSTFIKVLTISEAGEQLTLRLRVTSLGSMLARGVWWFDRPANSPSSLSSLLSSQVTFVPGVLTSLSSLVEVGAGILVAVVISMVSSWLLTLVVLGFIPLLLLAGALQVAMQRRALSGGHKYGDKLVVEAVTHIRTVKAFGLQNLFLSKYSKTVSEAEKRSVGPTVCAGIMFGFTNFIVFMAYAVTFRFAAFLLTRPVDHHLYVDFRQIFTVFLAVVLGSLVAGQAGSALTITSQALAAASKLLAIMQPHGEEDLEEKTEDKQKENGQELKPVLSGSLALSDVCFSFPSRPLAIVLRNLSFSLPSGHTLALVGHSGAGKSTVINLLERFYRPDHGSLLANGTDISSLSLGWWRSQLGWVPQQPVLFNRSIADNIAYGHWQPLSQSGLAEMEEQAKLAEVQAAAVAANVHDFIMSLPQGYETVVGSRGTLLSGGQRQRIAIARALIRQPQILLLDEATSSLDTESERIVQEALDKARQGRTTIIIAHRLSTIAGVDRIAVLREGQVCEEGNHKQLLEKKGLYWTLLSSQSQQA